MALERIAGVEKVVPVALGSARVEGNGLGRSVFIYGPPNVPRTWKFGLR